LLGPAGRHSDLIVLEDGAIVEQRTSYFFLLSDGEPIHIELLTVVLGVIELLKEARLRAIRLEAGVGVLR